MKRPLDVSRVWGSSYSGKARMEKDDRYVKLAGQYVLISYLREMYKYRDLYFVTYNRIFAVHYSQNAGFYATEIRTLRLQPGETPYTHRGRWHLINRAELSQLCPESDLILLKD